MQSEKLIAQQFRENVKFVNMNEKQGLLFPSEKDLSGQPGPGYRQGLYTGLFCQKCLNLEGVGYFLISMLPGTGPFITRLSDCSSSILYCVFGAKVDACHAMGTVCTPDWPAVSKTDIIKGTYKCTVSAANTVCCCTEGFCLDKESIVYTDNRFCYRMHPCF